MQMDPLEVRATKLTACVALVHSAEVLGQVELHHLMDDGSDPRHVEPLTSTSVAEKLLASQQAVQGLYRERFLLG